MIELISSGTDRVLEEESRNGFTCEPHAKSGMDPFRKKAIQKKNGEKDRINNQKAREGLKREKKTYGKFELLTRKFLETCQLLKFNKRS